MLCGAFKRQGKYHTIIHQHIQEVYLEEFEVYNFIRSNGFNFSFMIDVVCSTYICECLCMCVRQLAQNADANNWTTSLESGILQDAKGVHRSPNPKNCLLPQGQFRDKIEKKCTY